MRIAAQQWIQLASPSGTLGTARVLVFSQDRVSDWLTSTARAATTAARRLSSSKSFRCRWGLKLSQASSSCLQTDEARWPEKEQQRLRVVKRSLQQCGQRLRHARTPKTRARHARKHSHPRTHPAPPDRARPTTHARIHNNRGHVHVFELSDADGNPPLHQRGGGHLLQHAAAPHDAARSCSGETLHVARRPEEVAQGQK